MALPRHPSSFGTLPGKAGGNFATSFRPFWLTLAMPSARLVNSSSRDADGPERADGSTSEMVKLPRGSAPATPWSMLHRTAAPCCTLRTRLPSSKGLEARQAVLHPWPRASPARDGCELVTGVHKLPSIERSSHGARRAAVRSPCDAESAATPGACRGYRT